ncbi:MAG: hypothetical protein NVSMB47_12200 [Polyangiales bacterium]
MFATNLAMKFPWIRQHAMFMLMNLARQRMLVAVDAAGTPAMFEAVTDVTRLDDARFNKANMNELFQAEKLTLPHALSPSELAWNLRTLLAGLGGWVAGAELWRAEKDEIALWVGGMEHGGAELFRAHCVEPVLTRRDAGLWTLTCSYFNLSGGLESWVVEGNLREVVTARATMQLPHGTFLVPYG